MPATRKSIHFDLDTKKIEKICGSEDAKKMISATYYAIGKFLQPHGFEHRQGSGYTSKNGISFSEVSTLAKNMADKIPLFAECVKVIDVTSVGKTFDLLPAVQGETKEGTIEKDTPTRKAINFDLVYEALRESYFRKDGQPKEVTEAYHELGRFLQQHGFEHRQGSGYTTPGKISYAQVLNMVDSMTERFPWLEKSVGAIDVTYIGRTYDLLSVVKERKHDIAYHKAEDVNTKGDAVLVDGCHEIVLGDIPKEEWPYIADVKDGSIIIDDKAMERDGYVFDIPENIGRDDLELDEKEPEAEELGANEDRLGEEYGD